MNFLVNLFNSKDGKLILKNFSYLSVLRIFIILSQYILVSFLVRTLGSDTYGVFVWAFTIIQYLLILINFGFNTYAAKYIPECSGNQKSINSIFSSILYIKFFSFVISAVFFICLVLNVNALKETYAILFILMGIGLGEVLFPIWFFQGSEKLEIPTKIVFFFRLLLVLTTLLLITGPEHMLKYAFLLTITQIFIGLSGLIFSIFKLQIKLVWVELSIICKLLKEAFVFFIGALFGKTFHFFAIFFIGIYCSMEEVTSFDIAFKILAVMQLPFETLSTALFPTIARTKDLFLNQKIIFLGFLVSLLLWVITYWQAAFLMNLLGGEELAEYGPLLQQLSVLIPIVVLTYLLGTNTLVAFGYQKHFNYSFIIPSIIYILILSILWKLESINFELIVISRILVEVLMVLYRLIVAIKFRLIFISK